MKAKKRFGQNFLIDQNIINKIVNLIPSKEDTLILEIGPGYGALTKHLVNKGTNVLAYEIDRDCVEYLGQNIVNDNLTIINKDILEANILDDLAKYNYQYLYVVGNLPYYITTAIINKLIDSKIVANKFIFMVQNEVADRYTKLENNKEYNSLTVYLNYLFETKKEFIVPNSCFDPAPKVTSAIISFVNKDYPIKPLNLDYFLMVNKLIFTQKRKTLVNNLKLKYEDKIIKETLTNLSLKETIRAEELTIDDIIKLSDELFKLTNIYEYAYAKINLGLRVLDEVNGYHNIKSIMLPIDIKDTLLFIKSKEDKVISNIEIENNVLLKTIKLFKEKYNISEGVTVYLNKLIPLSAGLGGGSSDSSACLRGLNRLFNLNISLKELEQLANMLGSDNTMCLYSKPSLCEGRGEILTPIKVDKEIPLIIIKPSFGLSTKEIYTNYIYQDRTDETNDLITNLAKSNIDKLNPINDLEIPALLNKEYQEFVDKLNNLNITSYQSGSGPTRYIFDLDKYDILKKEFKDCLIIKTKIKNL